MDLPWPWVFIINDKRENYNSFLYSVNGMCPCTNLLDMVLSKVDWEKVGPHTHASFQHIRQNPISHMMQNLGCGHNLPQ